jgi:hypothetical protein
MNELEIAEKAKSELRNEIYAELVKMGKAAMGEFQANYDKLKREFCEKYQNGALIQSAVLDALKKLAEFIGVSSFAYLDAICNAST